MVGGIPIQVGQLSQFHKQFEGGKADDLMEL